VFRILKWLLLIVLFLGAVGAAIVFSGNTLTVIGWLWGPKHGWDLSRKAPEPDYAQASAWAAWPGRESPAGFVPQGVSTPEGARAVDVFFIHPTGYLNGGDWNSPMNPKSRTEENTQWMLANQASAYNGCCNVYAPRYREASIFRYWSAPDDIAQKTMDFAYADVVRAFDYYMANENKGRPFIIASHSQGTWHALRLIQEKIDGTNLQPSMIAAYIIGGQVTNAEVNALKSVKVCDGPAETGCIVHWATFLEGATVPPIMSDLVCVNPLTWRRDGGRAPAALHQGGVPPSGKFSGKLWGDDAPQGVVFEPLGAPMSKLTWAECKDGILRVADQSGNPLGKLAIFGNYHGLDYPLFHMDIRKNVAERVGAYLQRALTDGPAPAK
jgi:Protein of unknown function (DUF3089)